MTKAKCLVEPGAFAHGGPNVIMQDSINRESFKPYDKFEMP